MGSRMLLLLVLMLLMFTEHSQGVPETQKQSLTVSAFTDASTVGKPLTTVNPVNTPRQHNRLCNCKGKRRDAAAMGCHCQQFARHSGKHRKWKLSKSQFETWCKREKNKNLKKCRQFSREKKRGKTMKLRPSVPI